MHNHQPKADFKINTGSYTLKIANTPHELKSALNLRHKVFLKTDTQKLHIDKVDAVSDHLIILDQTTKAPVGYYRLNASSNLLHFDLKSEFNLKSFRLPFSNFLELNHACIDQKHRNGLILYLLWKGLYLYTEQIKTDFLFGNTNIQNVTPQQAALIYKYFEQNNLINTKSKITPRLSSKIPFFDDHYQSFTNSLSEAQIRHASQLIPKLLKVYIKAGAEIMSEPAYDSDTNSIKFLIGLKTLNLSKKFKRKFEKIKY